MFGDQFTIHKNWCIMQTETEITVYKDRQNLAGHFVIVVTLSLFGDTKFKK